MHFNLAHTGALPWLKAHADRGEDFYALIEFSSHATRIERSEEALVAVINDVHFDFSFEPSDISTLWLRLGALRRLLVRFQRLLAPEPASLFRLLQHPPAWIGSLDAEELRQTSEAFSLVLRDMGMPQERIRLLQVEIAA